MAVLLRTVRRSIALKLTLTLIGFVAISSVAAGLYLNRALEAFAVESLETRLGAVAAVAHDEAAAALGSGRAASMQELVGRLARSTGARVTLIAPDGRVLGESQRGLTELAAMDNHAARPEVRAALAGRQGRDLRHSTTIAAPLLYVAVPTAVNGNGLSLTVPDDYLSAVKYDALGWLLNKVGRLQDPERAAYCRQRQALTVTAAELILGGWA